VDKLTYAAQPYGVLDKERHPLAAWLNGDSNTNYGQARIVAHPKYFMQASCVRMHVASADPTFHRSRGKFQEELTQRLGAVLGDPEVRLQAATGIYGGTLPAWWTVDDQRRRKRDDLPDTGDNE